MPARGIHGSNNCSFEDRYLVRTWRSNINTTAGIFTSFIIKEILAWSYEVSILAMKIIHKSKVTGIQCSCDIPEFRDLSQNRARKPMQSVKVYTVNGYTGEQGHAVNGSKNECSDSCILESC